MTIRKAVPRAELQLARPGRESRFHFPRVPLLQRESTPGKAAPDYCLGLINLRGCWGRCRCPDRQVDARSRRANWHRYRHQPGPPFDSKEPVPLPDGRQCSYLFIRFLPRVAYRRNGSPGFGLRSTLGGSISRERTFSWAQFSGGGQSVQF